MIKSLIIYLGNKCNLNCSYCHRDIGEEIEINNGFLNSLSTFRGNIIFRGGEPTLYMDIIYKIVDIAKFAKFTITTNGILFEKYKEYFKKHDFTIYISYDGNAVRNFDPFLKEINYPKLYATSVITSGDDLYSILDNFNKKSMLIKHKLFFYPHIAHYTNDTNKQYAMTEEDYLKLSKQLKECMFSFVEHRKRFLCSTNEMYYGIYNFFRHSFMKNYKFGETYCANSWSKRVDLTGQQYNCLYIRNQLLDENWLDTQKNIIRNKFPKCETCSVYHMCGAGCVKSLYHDKECSFYYDIFSWYKEFYKEYEKYLFI